MLNLKLILVLVLGVFFSSLQAADIRIAAATNLRFMLPELAESFEQNTGHHLQISFAASGTLTTQLQHGAPFDVFMSANPDYILRLQQASLVEGAAIDFAQAQLALFASKYSALTLDEMLAGLQQALDKNLIHKIVIANPKHAPYGQLAQKILEKEDLWQQVQPYLLIAENASQALQFSLSPVATVGFIPYAYAVQPQITEQGRFIKLDAVIQQQAVLIKNANSEASEFLDFIQTQVAQTIFIKHGFLVDGGET